MGLRRDKSMDPCLVGFLKPRAVNPHPEDAPLVQDSVNDVGIRARETAGRPRSLVNRSFEIVAEIIRGRVEPLAEEFDVVSKRNERALKLWLEAGRTSCLIRVDNTRRSFDDKGETGLLVESNESAHTSTT